jgi:L-alanine-DL-glutamate epimerase-like enolase superfamily enzyme
MGSGSDTLMTDFIIEDFEVKDMRFPTSRELDGSDAINPDPNYSAAYFILKTNTSLEEHGLTSTIGRRNELEGNLRRAAIIREEVGWDCKLMMDANQKWEVDKAITNIKSLAKFDPWCIEELQFRWQNMARN